VNGDTLLEAGWRRRWGSHLLDANGHSDFGVLQAELGAKRSDKMVFYAFDLL
jgi:hypothetical protein